MSRGGSRRRDLTWPTWDCETQCFQFDSDSRVTPTYGQDRRPPGRGNLLMSTLDKRSLSEIDICDLFITPAIKDAGWDPMNQIRREVTLTPGPVIVRGNMSSRNKKKKKFADYVLSGARLPIAIVEAKDNNHTVSHGLQQALGLRRDSGVPAPLAPMATRSRRTTKSPAAGRGHRDTVCSRCVSGAGVLLEALQDVSRHQGRGRAIRRSALSRDRPARSRATTRPTPSTARSRPSQGQQRVLLVMATGTGKTYTTFQIIWRLWKAGRSSASSSWPIGTSWSIRRWSTTSSPSAGAMTKVAGIKIDPPTKSTWGCTRRITGPDEEDKIFKKLSRDFFDLIVIDECHRGSAAEDAPGARSSTTSRAPPRSA